MSDYYFVTEFFHKYSKFKEKDKVNFSRLTNKLLSVNFVTNQKESDIEDYYFITANLDLFKAYFSLMDYEINHYSNNRVIMVNNKMNYNRLNLKLSESIVLLILRLLYDEKMREVSLIDKVIITLENIHQMFLTTGLKDRRLSKTELKQILSVFKRFNLIDMIDYDYNQDDTRLVIYPTILYAVNIENINEVYKKLASYKKEGDGLEEVDEDQTN